MIGGNIHRASCLVTLAFSSDACAPRDADLGEIGSANRASQHAITWRGLFPPPLAPLGRFSGEPWSSNSPHFPLCFGFRPGLRLLFSLHVRMAGEKDFINSAMEITLITVLDLKI